MILYFALAVGALLIWYFIRRKRALDLSPEQQSLAAMMMSAVTDRKLADAGVIAKWLDDRGWRGGARSVRVSHALSLCRRGAQQDRIDVDAALLDLARWLLRT